MTKDMKSCLDF